MEHIWKPHGRVPHYLILEGHKDAMVRTKAMPDGSYLWQFRKTVSYADSIEKAKEYVEAGAEFFDVMHRNPYSK